MRAFRLRCIFLASMEASARARMRARAVLTAAAVALIAGSSPAQILPWEAAVAEIEAGRLRGLAARLSKQNLLYQLHLGGVRKQGLIETAQRIDRILESLERGVPSYSIPAPWTPEIREQLGRVDDLWGPIRRIAVASPYDQLRVSQQFVKPEARGGDPLLLRYFDLLCTDFIAETEKLIEIYDVECRKTGIEVCSTASTSGFAAMIIERAAKEAVYVVAGIDAAQNRRNLKSTIAAYLEIRRANDADPFYAAALDPERGVSAAAARELLLSLRQDWDRMQAEFTILAAGDEKNFDLRRMLETQSQLVAKVERLTAALIRYANLTYGS